jgi:hypothetical protein
MFKFIHFIGSVFLFIWFAIMIMDTDILKIIPMSYAELLLKYKWIILLAGVLFEAYGFSSVIKQKRKQKQGNSYEKNNSFTNAINRKDFITEQLQARAIQNIEATVGNRPELKELALNVDWTPLYGGGANFKTKRLVRVDDSRIEILHSTGGTLFAMAFILMGALIPGAIGFSIFYEKGFDWELLFILLFGLVFIGIGVAMLIYPKPRIFDKRQGWFWVGDKALEREQEFIQLKKSARISDIAAIQIIPERISGSKGGSYTSWEINLVSHDGKRLNVLDHGHNQSIIEDAQVLGNFLSVPVWENA